MNRRLNYLLIVLFTVSSCNVDSSNENEMNIHLCEEISDLGDFYLIEESKPFIPYDTNIVSVVFSDSLGVEYCGNVSYYGIALESSISTQPIPCPIDSSVQIIKRWKAESKSIRLQIVDIDIDLRISIRAGFVMEDYSYSKGPYDYCNFVLKSAINSSFPNTQMSMVANGDSSNMYNGNFSIYSDTLKIHNCSFEEVYIKMPNQGEEFILYYSKTVGVVGFKDVVGSTGINLKFVRTE